jgi:UDP-N-acetylmuramoylalanine--D-glutamate ligase
MCSVDVLQIPGEHNLSNATAAIDAVWKYTQDAAVIEKGLHDFKGLPHRLAFVRSVDGVDYYDDSIATTPTSAIAALRAFDTPKVIILGGSSKGSDFSELAKELTQHDVFALLIGDEAVHIAEVSQAAGFTNFEIIEAPTMEKVVARAHELARDSSVVLLSPATASFGLFKNYADRGDQFIAAVSSL